MSQQQSKQQSKKNPATGFLVMAGFNLVGTAAFVIFYFLYKDSGGESSFYLLIAALISAVSAAALLVLYGVFRKKLDSGGK